MFGLSQAVGLLGQQPNPSKNSFLVHACEVAIQLQAAHVPSPNDEATRFELSCVAYIQGFADSAALTHGFCVKGVSVGRLATEYVAYMKQHPEMLDQHKALGLAASIKEGHPCPAK